MSTLARWAVTSSTSVAWVANHGWSTRSSSTSTAPSAARHQASVPGRTWRWRSARSAVSVRRGSRTIIERAGSRAISLRVVRARAMPWLCHGFLPTKSATSASSKSPRTWVPSILPLTQNSPVFSWASAFERNREPMAARVPAE